VNPRKYVLILIVTILCLSPGQMFAEKSQTGTVISQKKSPPETDTKVKLYYFHGTRRCKTCLTLEANTKEALDKGFPGEMKQGTITWETYDTDKKENKHFETDFELLFSSVILVKYKADKQVEWKNLQKIWELVGDKPAFLEYVQNEVRSYLEK